MVGRAIAKPEDRMIYAHSSRSKTNKPTQLRENALLDTSSARSACVQELDVHAVSWSVPGKECNARPLIASALHLCK